jgi:hypothetical protein
MRAGVNLCRITHGEPPTNVSLPGRAAQYLRMTTSIRYSAAKQAAEISASALGHV